MSRYICPLLSDICPLTQMNRMKRFSKQTPNITVFDSIRIVIYKREKNKETEKKKYVDYSGMQHPRQ